MRALDDRDLRVLHVSSAYIEPMLPQLVDGIARELYAHPSARPYYTTLEQVRGQSNAWIRGVLGHQEVASLEAVLARVAHIHRRLGIPADFFVEVCAMIGEHIAEAADAMPVSAEVRAAVVRTFTRVLFRQAAMYCSAP